MKMDTRKIIREYVEEQDVQDEIFALPYEARKEIQTTLEDALMNPSEEETLLQLADELGLDFDQFMADLSSDDVEQALQQQIQFTRQLPIQGFPSWVLEVDGEYHAIAVDYDSAQTSLVRITEILKEHR